MPLIFVDAQVPRHPLLFANDSFLRLTGFAREDVVGKELALILGEVAEENTVSLIKTAVATGIETTWQLRCRRADASDFLAAVYFSPVRDEHGILIHHCLSFIHLSDQVSDPLARRDKLSSIYDKHPGSSQPRKVLITASRSQMPPTNGSSGAGGWSA